MKTIGVIIIAIAMLIALTGVVTADQLVPQVPEVHGITSAVTIVCDGRVTESTNVAFQTTDMDMYDSGLASRGANYAANWLSMLDPTQVQVMSTYDSSTIAQAGQTTFIKNTGVNSANKLLTQSNIQATTEAIYVMTGDGGNILGSENIMYDGAGMPTMASDRILCPFGNNQGNVIPAYCNIVTSGTAYNLLIGSVVTSANARFVGTDAGVPVETNSVINVRGFTSASGSTSPALGSASSFMRASIKEGRSGMIADNVSDLYTQGRLIDYDAYDQGWPITNGHYIPSTQVLTWQDVGYNMALWNMTGMSIGPQNEDITVSTAASGSGAITTFSTANRWLGGKIINV